ncbi:MAG: hypothetical protein AB7S48_00500 [Bacteroidales bacterium]
MLTNIYLDSQKKETYMDDFINLLDCKMEFWMLDDNLTDVLTNINKNQYIQTLYSKRNNLNSSDSEESYLKFCYHQALELPLFGFVLRDLVLNFNRKPETILYYDFSHPRENLNYSENTTKLGLGCTDNQNYFYINHISIFLESTDLNVHNDFWKELEHKLTTIKPA